VIASTPAGRAIIQAAAERRVGGPVYLRYAAEVPDAGDLIQEAAGAVAFAAGVLGEPSRVYAVGVGRGDDGVPRYLSLTIHHPDGAVALIGVGRGARFTAPPSMLLLGDQGAVERYPGPGADTEAVAGGMGDKGASDAGAEPVARFAAAIRRSLAEGTVEEVRAERDI
jgi:hypothetical protein